MTVEPGTILDFWKALGTEGQFRRNDAVDREIAEKFGETYEAAVRGELDGWRNAPDSCLALIIVLDQFSRNLFRDDPRAFAHDADARTVAREAIAAGFYQKVED